MKLTTRLLLAIPFAIVTFLYLRLSLADSGCSGLIEYGFTILLFMLFAVTIPIAFVAAFRKRQSYNGKPEPIALTITLMTLAILIIGKTFGESFKGSKWIFAESNKDQPSNQYLTLRNNGTFKIDLGYVDFNCYFSGKYQRHGDTVVLDKDIIAQTNSLLTTKYLLQDTLLKPISETGKDSVKFSEFIVITKQ